jgi:hypothetical protein
MPSDYTNKKGTGRKHNQSDHNINNVFAKGTHMKEEDVEARNVKGATGTILLTSPAMLAKTLWSSRAAVF